MALVVVVLGAVCALLLLPSVLRYVRHILQVARILYVTRGVPGPPCYPLVGALPTFLAAWSDMHGMLLRMRSKYGSTVRMPLFDRVVILVMDPDDVQMVCTHPSLACKPSHYQMLRHHLGMGLINMNGPAYRRHRKAITPSLHLDILQDFVPVFAKNAEAMVRRLRPLADSGAVFDVAPEFGKMANISVTETVLSTHLGDDEDALDDIVNALKNASDLIMWRTLRPWWENDLVFKLSSHHKAFHESADAMNAVVSRILDAKAAEVADGVPAPPRRRMAFLDHVLRSAEGANMTVDELRDELKTFLFTGSTTSMDFLSLVAVVLAIHPEVQRRAQQARIGRDLRRGRRGACRGGVRPSPHALPGVRAQGDAALRADGALLLPRGDRRRGAAVGAPAAPRLPGGARARRHAPRPAPLSGPDALRPGALPGRAESRTAPLRLHPVQRGVAQLRGPALRPHVRQGRDGDAAEAVLVPARARGAAPPRRAARRPRRHHVRARRRARPPAAQGLAQDLGHGLPDDAPSRARGVVALACSRGNELIKKDPVRRHLCF